MLFSSPFALVVGDGIVSLSFSSSDGLLFQTYLAARVILWPTESSEESSEEHFALLQVDEPLKQFWKHHFKDEKNQQLCVALMFYRGGNHCHIPTPTPVLEKNSGLLLPRPCQ